MKEIYYSFAQIMDDVNELIRQVNENWGKPDVIAGFSRGGLVPATMLSHYWNIPMIPISTRDISNGSAENFLTELDTIGQLDGKVLVVDDIVDSGETFKQFNDLVGTLNWKSAALIENVAQDLVELDYATNEINKEEEATWVVFQYEEHHRQSLFKNSETP